MKQFICGALFSLFFIVLVHNISSGDALGAVRDTIFICVIIVVAISKPVKKEDKP